MIGNQFVSAILRTFLNQQKKKKKKKDYEKLYTKQTSTASTTKLLSRIPNRIKISNEYFNLCMVEKSRYLDEIIKL